VFGKKDYQQLMVIRRMVRQFAMPIEIVAGETARAADGLALSSRNGYLSAEERDEAVQLSRALARMGARTRAGIAIVEVEREAMNELEQRGWSPDYLVVRRTEDLGSPESKDDALVVLGAAKLGNTRLIDNFQV
jgi:pantoate--beta-alanine ligase